MYNYLTNTNVQTGCKGGDDDDADQTGVGSRSHRGGGGGGGGLSVRRQSKEQDAAGMASGAAADAPAEAKCDFNGLELGAAAEDKHHLSPSSHPGGQTKWYVRTTHHVREINSLPSMVVFCPTHQIAA